MRIAIMQPYFIPYAGYFRLFASTDLFVVYDCVQFIRRGWIHRNQLPKQNDNLDWLTLPLVKAPQDVVISDLGFSSNASVRMQDQMTKFPIFKSAKFSNSEFYPIFTEFSLSPVVYIVNLLKIICRLLDLPCQIVCSSELNLSNEIKGQDRIIAITKHFKADSYINAPGGRELYDQNIFDRHDIKLHFLSSYQGSNHSILSRLLNENSISLRNEIVSQSIKN